MGAIRKRGKNYIITYYEGSGRRRWETVGPNLHEARQVLAERMSERRTGKSRVPRDKMTVAELVRKWKENYLTVQHQLGRLKPSTLRSYQSNLDGHIAPFFGAMALSDVKLASVEEFNGALEAVVLLERFRTAIAEAQARAEEMEPIIRVALIAAREAPAGVLPLSHQHRVSTVEMDLNQCENARATLQRHAAAMAKQRDQYESLGRTHVVAVLTVVRQARQAWCRDTLAMLRDKALELRTESESERLAHEALSRFDPNLLREVPQITWGAGPLDPPTLA